MEINHFQTLFLGTTKKFAIKSSHVKKFASLEVRLQKVRFQKVRLSFTCYKGSIKRNIQET